jgi:hypothetical protein
VKNESVKTLETRRGALLKRLAGVGAFVQGSFCVRSVKCGRPGCRCSQGEPHEAYVLTRKVRGKTATTHVPRDLREEVRSWAEQYRQIKGLIRQVSDLSDRIIRIHVRTKRAVAQNRSRARAMRRRSTTESSGTTSPGSSDG